MHLLQQVLTRRWYLGYKMGETVCSKDVISLLGQKDKWAVAQDALISMR